MSKIAAKTLLADFVRDPAQAKAFAEDPERFLSGKKITLGEKDRLALKACVEEWFESRAAALAEGGHTDMNTHTDYDDSDGHVNRNSHLDHNSSY